VDLIGNYISMNEGRSFYAYTRSSLYNFKLVEEQQFAIF